MSIVITVPITLLLTGAFFLVKGNRKFFNILNEFKKKLPPSHKKAKTGILPPVGFTLVDTSKMETHIDTKELDLLLKELETFNYKSIFFRRKEIEAYSKNIQRLIKTSAWEKFGIALVQQMLEEDKWDNHKPYLLGPRLGKLIKF